MNRHHRIIEKPKTVTTMKWTALIALVSLLSSPGARAGTYGDLTYTSDGSVIIITDCAETATDVILPDTIESLPVTSIGYRAFEYCTNLTSVSLGYNVTRIEDLAFGGCISLLEIALTNNVSSIGYKAFARCTRLTNAILGSAITNITIPAFWYCDNLAAISVDPANSFYASIDGVLFNNDITTLETFPAAKGGSYTIPDTVTNILERAFFSTRLSTVTIPASVIDIEDSVFKHGTNMTALIVDTANPAYCDLDGVLFNKDQTVIIQYPAGKTNSTYTVPGSVTDVGNGAFTRSPLSTVVLPNTVTNIGEYAFELSAIASITIPDSVMQIKRLAFLNCPNLAHLYFNGNPPSLETYFGVDAFVYYLQSANGWGAVFGGCPTALWNPVIQLGSGYGATTNGFSFNITGTADIPVRIEACTNLAEGAWTPLQATTLSGGSLDFSDPDWNSHPTRIYRITGP